MRHKPTLPWAAFSLALITLAVFVWELLGPGGIDGAREQFGCCPSLIAHGGLLPGTRLPALLGVFTGMFMHASWTHWLANMAILLAVALGLERILGWSKFLLLYFAGGIAAQLIIVLAHSDYAGAAVGASGAVNGVWAAWLLAPRANLSAMLPLVRPVAWRRWLRLAVQVAVAGVMCAAFAGWYGDSLFSLYAGAGWRVFWSTSFIAHLAGALCGAILFGAYLLITSRRANQARRSTAA